jgi:hypothetical protein
VRPGLSLMARAGCASVKCRARAKLVISGVSMLAVVLTLLCFPMLSCAHSHCTLCTFLTSAHACASHMCFGLLSCAFHPHLMPLSHASCHFPAPCLVSPWLPLSILYHHYHTFLPSPLFLDCLATLIVYNACNYTLDHREISTLLPLCFQFL